LALSALIPARLGPSPERSLEAGIPPDSENSAIRSFGAVPDFRTDGTGAFRVMCGFSHSADDDPIMAPGQPGASHSHMFFGNEGANAFATSDSIRNSGASTCHGGTLNRSAYWVPTMYRGDGNAIVPDQTHVYYKSGTVNPSSVQMFPAGLAIVAGNANTSSNQPAEIVRWLCTPDASESSDRPAQATMPQCSQGEFLQASVIFPQCWNSKQLNTRNQSHIAYPVNGVCPSTHPVPVPRINLNFLWRIGPEGMDRWRLASDRPGRVAGQSLHADWYDGWDRNVMSVWLNNCVRAQRNCRLGELGNGDKLSRHRLGRGAVGTALPGYYGSSVAGAPPRANPIGKLAASRVTSGGIYARGFTLDPNDTEAIQVSILVNGVTRWTGSADEHRAHLQRRFDIYGTNHGFKQFIPLGSGTHRVCGISTDATGQQKRLGCHNTTVDSSPQGIFDGIVPNSSGFGFFGWAYDPGAGGASSRIRIIVDGSTVTEVAADQYRASLARNQPGIGSNRGFRGRVDVSSGSHTVCAQVLNQGQGGTTDLGCHQVWVG